MKLKCKTYVGRQYSYAHWKLDGNFLTVQKSTTGVLKYISSRPTDLTKQLKPLITTTALLERVPGGGRLYGELWVPGFPASYVKTAIKNRDTRLRFDCFAHGFLDHDAGLEEVEADCIRWGVPFVPYYNTRIEEVFHRKLPKYCGCRIEGYVFKNGNRLDFAKWKPIKTIDLIVTGLTKGLGKFRGQVGALVCSTEEGFEVAKVSGMDDKTRASIARKDIGRVVEVAYQGVGSKGRLRFPRFVRWRDDKDDCPVSQDPELEKICLT